MKKISFLLTFCLFPISLFAQHVIRVAPMEGDATAALQKAIHQAATYGGEPVTIELQNADYHISRKEASAQVYHVSNTTSEVENPDPTKHIGLWMKDLKHVTIDGKGAHLITHGEMTSFLMDGCEDICMKNLTLSAADPTVPEMTVEEVGADYLTARIHSQSNYVVEQGKLSFLGESWKLADGIAQLYDPKKDITWRCWSPLEEQKRAVELSPRLVRLEFAKAPEVLPGMTFQMRDSYRDEVCGMMQGCKDILLEHIHFAFLGNFGIVGQASENLTYRHLTFAPLPESGRTCAGFADFIQMSGCKGKITIEDSYFSGAHDDPINVHGTHLQVMKFLSDRKLVVRYMHHQTYGFQSFFPGNEIEFVSQNSLLPLCANSVVKAEMKNEREIELTLDKPVSAEVRQRQDLVVENVTYTPQVFIRNNYFSRVPTRGILVTTRRKVVIENNTFFRMQMSGILIADDGKSWFESGMVRDVLIRNNRFIECGSPVIYIAPENSEDKGCVHSGIKIENNRFLLLDKQAISAKSVEGLSVKDNCFQLSQPANLPELIQVKESRQVEIGPNRLEIK